MDSENQPTTQYRRWTDAELHGLFQDYFRRLPGTCPVCAHEVAMMMDHQDSGMAILTIRCRHCGNSSVVMA